MTGMPNLIWGLIILVIGLYILGVIKNLYDSKITGKKEKKMEFEKIKKFKEDFLIIPLSEKIKPLSPKDIVGQGDGLKALEKVLSNPNPQHVLIYGPPGVGKTSATRVIFEKIKADTKSIFAEKSRLIEINIGDFNYNGQAIRKTLFGGVQEPVYSKFEVPNQGRAPQPVLGAVSKACGGILFLDEIDKLGGIELDRLLKVLDDKKVTLKSQYYHSGNANIPKHIHNIFQNGLAADFRLVGATCMSPGDLPVQLRMRCIEIYFAPLIEDEIETIIRNICTRVGFEVKEDVVKEIKKHATNAREVINIMEAIRANIVARANDKISLNDVKEAIGNDNYILKRDKKKQATIFVASTNGLSLINNSAAKVIRIEATAIKLPIKGKGRIIITGNSNRKDKGLYKLTKQNKSRLIKSGDNILLILRERFNIDLRDYDIHLNFKGGTPLDESSIEIAVITAIYSAITNKPIDQQLAMTGGLSDCGDVRGVEEITNKIQAANKAGYSRMLIPNDNYKNEFEIFGIKVIPVADIGQVFKQVMMGIQLNKGEIVSGEKVGPSIGPGKKE